MSSRLPDATHYRLKAAENPVFLDQLTFKSLLEDAKEDTPDKSYKDRSQELTPILSLAVDALVHSPNGLQSDLAKFKLSISDFELKNLEKRVAGDLFSSAKKKYSCHFDGIALDTCSTSSERSESMHPVAVFDQVFSSLDASLGHDAAHGSTASRLESPLASERQASLAGAAQVSLKKLRLADYMETDAASANLSPVVQELSRLVALRAAQLTPGSGLRRNLRGIKTSLEGRFSLF